VETADRERKFMTDDYRKPTEHAKVNVFAIRCFRDTADQDYVAARLAMRSGLAGPFLWSALHAVEKYLKCILFLHRVRTQGLSHDIKSALARINNELPFSIALKPAEQQLFDHLAEWGGDRYLLVSFMLDNYELFQLDALVWKLRLYCQSLNKRHYADEPSEKILRERLVEIDEILSGKNKLAGHIAGGVLEQILEKRDHPAHDALTWQNLFYARTKRKSIRYQPGWRAVNAPLFNHPELADIVAQWMKIPGPILEGARMLAKENSAARKKEDREKSAES
jgi:hypothetical protein